MATLSIGTNTKTQQYNIQDINMSRAPAHQTVTREQKTNQQILLS